MKSTIRLIALLLLVLFIAILTSACTKEEDKVTPIQPPVTHKFEYKYEVRDFIYPMNSPEINIQYTDSIGGAREENFEHLLRESPITVHRWHSTDMPESMNMIFTVKEVLNTQLYITLYIVIDDIVVSQATGTTNCTGNQWDCIAIGYKPKTN